MWPFKRRLNLDQKIINDVIPKIDVNFTPDFMWLERHRWVLLFVYDELMRNRNGFHMLGEVKYRGRAFTERHEWTMWKKKLGTETFPIALRNAGIGHNRRIKGELFAVRPQILWQRLDIAFLNTIEFTRERVRILRPRVTDGQQFIDELNVFMYVGKPDYWINQIDNGFQYQIVKAFDPKIKWSDGHVFGSYYCYTRLEDDTNF